MTDSEGRDILALSVTNDNIISLISVGDWHEVLHALTEDMDPWDIDLVLLSNRLTEHIEHMRKLDLRIPAKILLAAAIIYKLKSERINYLEEDPVEEDEFFSGDFSLEGEDSALSSDEQTIFLPPIQLPVRRTPKRRVTLNELVDALDKAMKIRTRREARAFFQIDLGAEDLSKNIEELYKRICAFLRKQKKVTFSELISSESTKERKITAFNSMLHLASEGKIVCFQPELFGEIEIYGA